MKKTLFSILFFALAFAVNLKAQLNVTFAGSVSYNEELSDVWGYVDPNGVEYAIVGVYNGISIVSLEDPSNPTELFFIPGANSTWRDIKTWKGYAYVTNETANGLAVVDLTNLPNSIDHFDWTPNIFGLGELVSAHNIYIDEFGYAYLAGANINNGGMIYVDVDSTPGSPIYAGAGPAVYSHDVYVRNNKMYSSEIYLGEFSIYDVTFKNNTIYLGGASTYSNFTHNAWLSDDSNYLFTTDEVANGRIGSYDVSDPTNIIELDQFYPFETLGDGVIPHNVHVWNDWIIISYYTDGCIIVDASDPTNLVEVGNFDTFIPSNTGFSGAWGAYPFLPSGLILISDINTGLYVLEPNYVRACLLEGTVTDANSGAAIANVNIKIEGTNTFENSSTEGTFATGYAVAGTYNVQVSKAGYLPKTISVDLVNGETTTLNVALEPLTSFAFSGSVIDKGTGVVIPNANVIIENDTYNFEVTTDNFGGFTIPNFYEATYDVAVAKWGYKSTENYILSASPVNNSLVIMVEPGYEDTFSFDLGWDIVTTASSGAWELGDPIGVSGQSGTLLTPDEDVTEDVGNSCYITGNNADLFSGVVIGGSTALTSPEFKIEDYSKPKLGFYYWYFNANPNNGNPSSNYFFKLTIDNGTEAVSDSLYFDNFDDLGWIYHEIDLADKMTVTDKMTFSVEVAASNNFSVVAEGGFDYFRVWDDAAVPTIGANALEDKVDFVIAPNISSDAFTMDYSFREKAGMPVARIYNVLGQFVESIALHNQSGQVRFGDLLAKGIYYVQIADGFAVSKSLKVVKQ